MNLRFAHRAMVPLLILLTVSYSQARGSGDERFATRTGRTITVHPSRVRFDVPTDWMEWYGKFHNNLHVTRPELGKVEFGHGEMNTEYAEVLHAVFKFQDCAAHVGGDGWGAEGTSYQDPQLRVYVTDENVNAVVERIRTDGLAIARKLAHPSPGQLAELRAEAEYSDKGFDGRWRHVQLQFPLWFGDYDVMARVRFYILPIADRSVVFAFMGGNTETIEQIIGSVSEN